MNSTPGTALLENILVTVELSVRIIVVHHLITKCLTLFRLDCLIFIWIFKGDDVHLCENLAKIILHIDDVAEQSIVCRSAYVSSSLTRTTSSICSQASLKITFVDHFRTGRNGAAWPGRLISGRPKIGSVSTRSCAFTLALLFTHFHRFSDDDYPGPDSNHSGIEPGSSEKIIILGFWTSE